MKKLMLLTLLTLSFNAFAGEESKTPEAETTKTAEQWFRAGALDEYFEGLLSSSNRLLKSEETSPKLKAGTHAQIVSIGRQLVPPFSAHVWTHETWHKEEITQTEFNSRVSVCSFGQVVEGDLDTLPNPFGDVPMKTAEEWFRAGYLDRAFVLSLPAGQHAAIEKIGKSYEFGGIVWTEKTWFNSPITYAEFFKRAIACTILSVKAELVDIPSPFARP